MNCWHCGHELRWEADHDIEDEFEDYAVLTSLHCDECHSDVEVYLPKKEGA